MLRIVSHLRFLLLIIKNIQVWYRYQIIFLNAKLLNTVVVILDLVLEYWLSVELIIMNLKTILLIVWRLFRSLQWLQIKVWGTVEGDSLLGSCSLIEKYIENSHLLNWQYSSFCYPTPNKDYDILSAQHKNDEIIKCLHQTSVLT